MSNMCEWLQLFQKISCLYVQMSMLPLWGKYPNHEKDVINSLAIFLEGYAFERQGRKPDYFHAAVDSLIDCRNSLTAHCVWDKFKKKLKNRNLNHKNNPIYPSDDPDSVLNTSKDNNESIIEALSNSNSTISNYMKNLIDKNKDIVSSFTLLKSIRGIGNKIASFYLRDLVVVLNINVANSSNRELLQPIDIWVRRTIKYLSSNKAENDKQIAKWIIDESLKYDLSPERVNMGVWFYCSVIANSEYRLNKSLQNIKTAQSLVQEYYSGISNVCKSCHDGWNSLWAEVKH